jgi:hypothetical protein
MSDVPVVFIVFNRPDLTARVLDRIRAARPRSLYVIADGPRDDADRPLCQAVRVLIDGIDWNCQVIRDFSEHNLGCKRRVASGLTNAFQRFDRAIVIEDDVLPAESFFGFARQMLDRYDDDPRVMMVSGFNPLGAHRADERDYHFSFCGSIWGWASWARCWKHYDVEMRDWATPGVRERVIETFGGEEIAAPRVSAYDRTFRGELDTWDFQWSFARIARAGLSVVPAKNLISNLGFRADATHTRRASALADVPLGELRLPVRVHEDLLVDREYDLQFTRLVAGPPRR